MKKKFLGIICLTYTLIISYAWVLDKLKNFLAPQMQIYIKLSLFPLFVISLILIVDKNINYKSKWTDLVLLLPLLMIITSGDGKITETASKTRMTNYKKEIKEDAREKEDVIEKLSEDDEMYFEIVDANYQDLANYLTFSPKSYKFAGKKIKVKGFVNKNEENLQKGYFSFGKYAITCCAADASFVGFIVKDNGLDFQENSWYEIEGKLENAKDKAGYDILAINPLEIKQIDSSKEEQYVYPCYNYDEKCKEVTKYGLAY